MKNIYIAHLHSLGFTQKDLHAMKEQGRVWRDIFDNAELFSETLQSVVRDEKRRGKIQNARSKYTPEKTEEILRKLNVSLVSFDDTEYPEGLRHISNPPYVLYVRGVIPTQEMFAIVGTRKISAYGKRIISSVGGEIAKVFPIVSGGAAGCDTYAHKIALENNTSTVVVFGTGVDQVYPYENRELFEKIVLHGGTIISSFPVGEKGLPYNFPVRNEIVVGLSRGILVVEAEEKSGSLITARLALDHGKDLFAVPGDIFHGLSAGTNKLIQSGSAKITLGANDILEEYDIQVKKISQEKVLSGLTSGQRIIYCELESGPLSLDDLYEKIGISLGELSQDITLLEILGCIKKDLGGRYYIC